MTNQTWQPIETAPKDGTPVLIWMKYGSQAVTAEWRGGRWRAVWDGWSVIESESDFGTECREVEVPTHWMQLPAPPVMRIDAESASNARE